jgi:hypothetical protein
MLKLLGLQLMDKANQSRSTAFKYKEMMGTGTLNLITAQELTQLSLHVTFHSLYSELLLSILFLTNLSLYK